MEFKKLKCILRLKHKPSPIGDFVDKEGDYAYKWKCERCGAFLGLPTMTDKFIKDNFPIPSRPKIK
jgi:hypothetical protein